MVAARRYGAKKKAPPAATICFPVIFLLPMV